MLPESLADLKFAVSIGFGFALIVLARWAVSRGEKWDSWVALRVGRVLLTEVVGAFLLGYGVGLLIEQLTATSVRGGPPGRVIVAPGRFGFGPSISITLGTVGAVIAILTRVDIGELFVRDSSAPRGGLSTYVGWRGQVVAPIRAGEFGQVTIRDAMGYPLSAVATAESDLPQGTAVQVVGVKGLNLVVAPLPSTASEAPIQSPEPSPERSHPPA